MGKLVFRENNDKYDEPVIEVGDWWERDDGSKFFSAVLDIMPKEDTVYTNCGDQYYDYSINFDDFLEIADKIKELQGHKMENNEQHKKGLAELDGWMQGYREGYSDAMKIVREAITTLTNALVNDIKEGEKDKEKGE